MGRYRSRSRSYSPRRGRSRTPPRPRRKRYDDPHDHHRYRSSSYRGRRSPAPSGLLVRNVALDTRPEDLRIPFEKFGPVKDVYLPRNYYTGEPRGFGFVKFRHPDDAAEAKERLDHTIIGGREIRIVYAEENRKTPQEMRRTSHTSGPSGRYGGRRRTPPRSPRRRYRSYSRSPSSVRHRSRSVSRSRSPRSERDYKSTKRSASPRESSPCDERGYRKRERSQSPRKTSAGEEKEYKSRRSYSPRELSPHDGNYRSSRRSFSPSEESPNCMRSKTKQRVATSSEVSPHDDDYKSKRSPSPEYFSKHGVRRGALSQFTPSPRWLSPIDESGDRLKDRSLSTEENDGRSQDGRRDLASRKSVSPRRNGRSVSQSYSPR